MTQLASRGRWLWRQEWYSICSAHRHGGPNDPCARCQAGSWHNVVGLKLSGVLFTVNPALWRWLVNLRRN